MRTPASTGKPSSTNACGASSIAHGNSSDVAFAPVVLGELARALLGAAEAAAGGRAHQQLVALGEPQLAAAVLPLAVQADLAARAVRSAGDAGRGLLGAVGVEGDVDRVFGERLEQELLAVAAALPAGAAAAHADLLEVQAQRRELLDHLHRGRGHVARPREHVRAVLAGGGAGAAVGE